ncbi:27 kDa glycoprotein [Drosophila madeirensis]|uniref:27 kDa glycoprotein n=1 Tax=Drosophila madeirensis TaxID=30013 RepID=A0AAU9FYE0_DROMD
MERTPSATHLLLLAVIGWGCCLALGAGQLPEVDPATVKDLEELGAHYLPAGYTKANVSLADLQRLLRAKCEKANQALPAGSVNATALGTAIEQAGGQLMGCIGGLANVTEILDEIEKASPKGDLDVVFEKYCLRLPQAKACLRDFNAALQPCLTREERSHNALMQRIMDKLLEFVCYKNGDQIALFIAEQGPECLQASRDHIATCLNTTFSGYLPQVGQLSSENVADLLPELVLGPRQCVDLHDFEICTVRHLERCETITPSNIVESMFRYVRKESNCQPAIDRALQERRRAQALTAADPAVGGAASLAFVGRLLLLLAPLVARL